MDLQWMQVCRFKKNVCWTYVQLQVTALWMRVSMVISGGKRKLPAWLPFQSNAGFTHADIHVDMCVCMRVWLHVSSWTKHKRIHSVVVFVDFCWYIWAFWLDNYSMLIICHHRNPWPITNQQPWINYIIAVANSSSMPLLSPTTTSDTHCLRSAVTK